MGRGGGWPTRHLCRGPEGWRGSCAAEPEAAEAARSDSTPLVPPYSSTWMRADHAIPGQRVRRPVSQRKLPRPAMYRLEARTGDEAAGRTALANLVPEPDRPWRAFSC